MSANPTTHAWKACWVNTLTSSNLVSSASATRANVRGPDLRVRPSARRPSQFPARSQARRSNETLERSSASTLLRHHAFMSLLPLESKQLRSARAAARAGRYQLFLGAGASVGATNPTGALPLASELVKILASRYPKAPIDEGDSLPRAYQRAIRVSSREEVWSHLRMIFQGASHLAWFQEMTHLPWRRVWTLNIDDTFENAYGAGSPEERKLQVVDWQDPYSESGDLQVIHLHGHVMGKVPRTLVFSFAEYQSAARTHPVWDQVLGGVIGTEPFLIIGARMLNDQDIEALLMHNPPHGTAPSFVVDPFISAGNKWELEQLGFIVLQEMPEKVIEDWQETFDLDPESLGTLRKSNGLSVPQFSKLQTNLVKPAPKDHDFYGGDAPLWSDIVSDRVAILQWMKGIIEHLEKWLDTSAPSPALHIVYASRLTGASSGLLAIAKESIRLNATPYLFDKSSRWDVALAVDLAKDHPTVFLIDGAADFADDIDRTLKLATEQGAKLYILATELPRNDLRFEGRLVGQYTKSVTSSPERLDRLDSSSLASKLEKFGRLGSLELKEKRERTRHFVNRDVFSAMMDVEYALGFRKRLEGELGALEPDWRLDLALLLSLAAQGNRTVGIVDAAIAIGTSIETISHGLREDEHLSALIEHVDDRIVARQRGSAVEPAINALGPKIALNKLLGFIQRLAPLASRASLQNRNRVPLLVGHLMTTRNMQTAFPGHDLDDFYEALRPTFGDWNGRYWEQRAIYAKSTSDWSRAESFAARSVSLYDDAYTRTTYGTILINKAENLASLNDPAWQGYYNRGKEQLETAQLKEPGSRVTAFAFLDSALALLQHLSRNDVGSDAARSVAADWKASYASLRVSLSGETELQSISRTEKLGERWAKLSPQIG